MKFNIKKLVPGRSITATNPKSKKFGLVGVQKPGRMSKANASGYKVPKTPKISGKGWGY